MTAPARRDPLADEIRAIATIGRALARIPDPAARLRVLRWAVESFHPELASIPAGESAQSAPAVDSHADTAADPALALGSIEHLFEHDGSQLPRVAVMRHRHGPVESLIRRFVSEWRRVVVQWQGV